MNKDIFRASFLFFALAGVPPFAQAVDLDPDKVIEDCRTEAEAGGVRDADLNAFVAECVAALLEEVDGSGNQQTAKARK